MWGRGDGGRSVSPFESSSRRIRNMLKRLRQLHISLAAKCQIVFGAAVVLIISAALFVPWQRMEQLTEQLNEKAASAVARTVVADHVMRARATAANSEPGTAPTTRLSAALATMPATNAASTTR